LANTYDKCLVGWGKGILTLGAARRLTTGQVIGIDIWTAGSCDKRLEAFVEKAKIKGVADRVETYVFYCHRLCRKMV
jgi:hypothetical protein